MSFTISSRRVGLIDREGDFDPAIKIARHPVGTGEVNVGLAGIFKIVNAAVLEKSSDDADDANIFAERRHSRAQTTNAANDEIDLHASAGRFIKFLDDILVNERI